jgi:hypothetical protein
MLKLNSKTPLHEYNMELLTFKRGNVTHVDQTTTWWDNTLKVAQNHSERKHDPSTCGRITLDFGHPFFHSKSHFIISDNVSL